MRVLRCRITAKALSSPGRRRAQQTCREVGIEARTLFRCSAGAGPGLDRCWAGTPRKVSNASRSLRLGRLLRTAGHALPVRQRITHPVALGWVRTGRPLSILPVLRICDLAVLLRSTCHERATPLRTSGLFGHPTLRPVAAAVPNANGQKGLSAASVGANHGVRAAGKAASPDDAPGVTAQICRAPVVPPRRPVAVQTRDRFG